MSYPRLYVILDPTDWETGYNRFFSVNQTASSSKTSLSMIQEINGTMETRDSIDVQCDHFFTASRKTNDVVSFTTGLIGLFAPNASVKLLNEGNV